MRRVSDSSGDNVGMYVGYTRKEMLLLPEEALK
jgi:hypothetical protein